MRLVVTVLDICPLTFGIVVANMIQKVLSLRKFPLVEGDRQHVTNMSRIIVVCARKKI